MHIFSSFLTFSVVSEQLWLFNGQVEDSTVGNFFHPLNGTEHGSLPSLTTRIDPVSVLEVRIEPGDSYFLLEPKTSDSAVRHSTNSTSGWEYHLYIL